MTTIYVIEVRYLGENTVPVVAEYDAKETPKQYKYKSLFGYNTTKAKGDPSIHLSKEDAIRGYVNLCSRQVDHASKQYYRAEERLKKAKELLYDVLTMQANGEQK